MTTTTREALLQSLQALLVDDDFFPADAAIDAPEPQDWRELDGGLSDTAAVQDGPVTVLREACGEGDTWELQLEAALVYAVAGADAAARRARRDEGGKRMGDLVAADRTLGGVAGLETYAETEPLERDDAQLSRDTVPAASAVLPVRITYTAASPHD